MQKSGLWPRLLLWPLVWGSPRHPMCTHRYPPLTWIWDVICVASMALSPGPLGAGRHCLNHSSTRVHH